MLCPAVILGRRIDFSSPAVPRSRDTELESGAVMLFSSKRTPSASGQHTEYSEQRFKARCAPAGSSAASQPVLGPPEPGELCWQLALPSLQLDQHFQALPGATGTTPTPQPEILHSGFARSSATLLCKDALQIFFQVRLERDFPQGLGGTGQRQAYVG